MVVRRKARTTSRKDGHGKSEALPGRSRSVSLIRSTRVSTRPGRNYRVGTNWVSRVAADVTLQPRVALSARCQVQDPIRHGGIPRRRGRFTICSARRAATLAAGDRARRRRSVLDGPSRLLGDEWRYSAHRSTPLVARSAYDMCLAYSHTGSASTRGARMQWSASTRSNSRWYRSVRRSRSPKPGRRHQWACTIQSCPLNSCSPSTFSHQRPVGAEQIEVVIRILACDDKRHYTSK